MNSFEIYKTETEYTSNGVLYGSEIWSPCFTNLKDIIKLRCLPHEIPTSTPKLMFNAATDIIFPHKETVEYYITQGHYIDAVHRLMYLSLIKGQDNLNLFDFMKDDGLMHELLHLKSNYSYPDITYLINHANEFEKSIPGTLLWVTNHTLT